MSSPNPIQNLFDTYHAYNSSLKQSLELCAPIAESPGSSGESVKPYESLEEMKQFATVKVIDTEKEFEAWVAEEEKAQAGASAEAMVMYRGQGEAKWRVTSTLLRSLPGNSTPEQFHKAEQELFKNAWEVPIRCTNNEQLLMAMQHYGARTPIIDFSYDVAVALCFAVDGCKEAVDDEELHQYFSVVRLCTGPELVDWESVYKGCIQNLENNGVSGSKTATLRLSAVFEDLAGVSTPVWISSEGCRELDNPRLQAQKGCFIYLGKYSHCCLERVFAAIRQRNIKNGLYREKAVQGFEVQCILIRKSLKDCVDAYVKEHGISMQTLMCEAPHSEA